MKLIGEWTAIHNHMPGSGKPPKLTVSGQVQFDTEGWVATLHPRTPQGINPKILLMELVARPETAGGNPKETTVAVSWSEHTETEYDQVSISVDDDTADGVTIDVQCVY